jgi:hypothetical protein
MPTRVLAITTSPCETREGQRGIVADGKRPTFPSIASATTQRMCRDLRPAKKYNLISKLVGHALGSTTVVHSGVAMQYVWRQAPVQRSVNKMALPFITHGMYPTPEFYQLKVREATCRLISVWLT